MNTHKIIILLLLALVSCKTHQPHTSHYSHTSHTSHDTLIITRTLPIHDTLYIPIAPPRTGNNQCDTLCQQQLQQLLERLNTAKHSGQNNYGIYYDKYRQQLILYQNLQQQLNTYKSRNQQIHTSLYKMQPVPYVPTWIKILATIGILVVIYICYRISQFFTLKP
ncbi:hypothetical protein [Capnocytophaga sputigena]|uniref:hypothetical protein n=1 Tax=Capnocytophaga sputigena TaxID=1019 RepID=UPI0028D2936F|nr:hypothetical protein [Capnocytophaga sputigena]